MCKLHGINRCTICITRTPLEQIDTLRTVLSMREQDLRVKRDALRRAETPAEVAVAQAWVDLSKAVRDSLIDRIAALWAAHKATT